MVFLRPGDVTDISLDLTAPDEAGTYRDVWQLVNGAGTLFVNGLSVEIEVVERIAQPTLPPTEDRGYDLLRFVADVTIPDRTVLIRGRNLPRPGASATAVRRRGVPVTSWYLSTEIASAVPSPSRCKVRPRLDRLKCPPRWLRQICRGSIVVTGKRAILPEICLVLSCL